MSSKFCLCTPFTIFSFAYICQDVKNNACLRLYCPIMNKLVILTIQQSVFSWFLQQCSKDREKILSRVAKASQRPGLVGG